MFSPHNKHVSLNKVSHSNLFRKDYDGTAREVLAHHKLYQFSKRKFPLDSISQRAFNGRLKTHLCPPKPTIPFSLKKKKKHQTSRHWNKMCFKWAGDLHIERSAYPPWFPIRITFQDYIDAKVSSQDIQMQWVRVIFWKPDRWFWYTAKAENH